jgi:glycosyltransferase involved in cell wall biosynthesis
LHAFNHVDGEKTSLMRFSVFTHVAHHEKESRYYAYSPYVREMNVWLRNVNEIEIVAPAPLPPKGEFYLGGSVSGSAYKHADITFTTIPSFHLLSFSAFLKAIYKIPIIFIRIMGAMRTADHLHLRCPGNIGLIACVAQMFFPRKQKSAKYAGNWDPQARQPRTYKLQKWILSNTFLTRNMQVLVYGDWPDQSKNILPFFTASFSELEKGPVNKTFTAPYRFLFVGNLVEGKNPLIAIKIVEHLKSRGLEAKLEMYGDGPLRSDLEKYVNENVLNDFVFFKGSRPLEELKQAYKDSHFLILASKSEGWPKAVAEGMFFGCIPVATAVSCVPWMLAAPPAPEGGAKNAFGSKSGIVTRAGRGILISDLNEVGEVRGQRSEDSQYVVSYTHIPAH